MSKEVEEAFADLVVRLRERVELLKLGEAQGRYLWGSVVLENLIGDLEPDPEDDVI